LISVASEEHVKPRVALLLLLLALAATLIPVRVAMNIEPVAALRYE
jgi:ABC-type lipoprotein release transport system permease subunit